MKSTLGKAAIAASTLACAALFSPGWSEQSGITLSIAKAEAATRIYVARNYAASATYYTVTGLPWYAVRAYYAGGPWVGMYTGWDDYAARNGISCTPGTAIKGADGIMYLCQ
jgi:hypothetical protein